MCAANDIDEELFKNLDKDQFEELIPSLGLRTKFSNCYDTEKFNFFSEFGSCKSLNSSNSSDLSILQRQNSTQKIICEAESEIYVEPMILQENHENQENINSNKISITHFPSSSHSKVPLKGLFRKNFENKYYDNMFLLK